jgi:hypothetical protein
MIIEKRAGNLSQKLANAGLGDRSIIFVTHSMGGLVVKSLIVDSQIHADLDRKKLANAVRGIVFCATPHRGSNFADAADLLGRFFGGAQAHVLEMRANAEPIDFLHEQFIEWHRHHPIPIDSYAENVALLQRRWFFRTVPLGLVVPRASANTGIAGHTVRDVDEDHLSIVKPRNQQHDVYAGVLRFIRSALSADAERGRTAAIGSPAPHKGSRPESQPVNEELHPSSNEPRTTELAFAERGLYEEAAPLIVTVCLVTDEPARLTAEVDNWKQRIADDALLPKEVRMQARHRDLVTLFSDSSVRAKLLGRLAMTSFSAYVYYGYRNQMQTMQHKALEQVFVDEPLVHRISKKSEMIKAVHGALASLPSSVRNALEAVATRFGYSVPNPRVITDGSGRSRALFELANLVAHAVSQHLAAPQDSDHRVLFDHLRTRIRFAQNVPTGEKHTRDKNPLH